MRVLIAGSRYIDLTYADFRGVLIEEFNAMFNEGIIKSKDDIEMISGGAIGVDTYAHMFAIEKDIRFREFPADWDTHGRGAGYIRNSQMVEYIALSDQNRTYVFWDGKSRGTKHTIDLVSKKKLPLKIFTK